VFDFFKTKKAKTNTGRSPYPLWELDLPVQEIKAVVLDTELTGLDRKRDSIVSIGAVKMAGGRVEIGRTFYQLVNPHMEMKAQIVIVHEITPSEVLEKPDIGPVLSEFLDFCGRDILIGHYVSLDLAFINRELKRTQSRTLENPAFDTMSLMHWWRSNTPGLGPDFFTSKKFELVEMAKELGIQVQGAHNALMDAFMTAQVFQRMLPRLQALGIKTLGDLLRVGHPDRKIEPPGGMM
jgi:DNA polymerase III subunit epsilon